MASRVESSMFSTKPAPKVGVGIRKITSFSCWAVAKLGCERLQLPASERPETVNRSSTPPFGELVFTLPLALKKNGKRASRVGPVAVMNDGSVLKLPLAMPLVITWLSGLGPMSGYMLALGLEPPIVGCE